MKRIIPTLLVSMGMYGCMMYTPNQGDRVSWGPESDGLRCGLSYESTAVSVGTPSRLKIIVENLSDKPMTIPELTDDTVYLTAGPIILIRNSGRLDKTVVIQPKERLSHTKNFDFAHCLFEEHTNRIVTVFATYHSRFGPRIQLRTGDVKFTIK